MLTRPISLSDWTMGTLSNDPYQLARFAGVYKAVQSAGGAISFAMDSVKVRHHGARKHSVSCRS